MKENRSTFNKLNVDCAMIAKNYASIKNFVGSRVTCAATIKADAYGLGMVPIMRCLSKAGCNKFFVRTLDEAIDIRNFSITDEIYVLDGISEGEEMDFAQFQIIPVLNTKEQFMLFNNYCTKKSKNLESALNIDTGLSYVGIPASEALILSEQGFFKQRAKIKFIMSELACGSDIDNPYNKQQLDLLNKLRQVFKLPVSLASSSSICLGHEYHFDMVRPGGMILYGVKDITNSFSLYPAVSLTSKIVQIKQATENLFVGYDRLGSVSKGVTLATIPIGYGDGIMRSLGNKGVFYINGEPAPIVGNIAIDFTVIDVSKVNKYFVHLGSEVEILGENSMLSSLADAAGTNCYEVLISLSKVKKKRFLN